MASETIVAVFEAADAAEDAVRDLRSAGIPDSAIQHYTKQHRFGNESKPDAGTAVPPALENRKQGFWAWLTGADTEHQERLNIMQRTVFVQGEGYDRQIEKGATVVTVITDPVRAGDIVQLLEEHDPVQLEEHQPTESTAAGAETGAAGAVPPHGDFASGAPNPSRVHRYATTRLPDEQQRHRNETTEAYRQPLVGGSAIGGVDPNP
jgi:hypothetical protein